MKHYTRPIKKPSSKSATYPLKNKSDINKILIYLVQQKEHAKTFVKRFKAERNYVLCLTGFNTAFRIEDLLQLFVKDVSKGFINIIENKTGKSQVFKLNKNLYEILMNYITEYNLKDHDYLFPIFPGAPKPITRQRVNKILDEIARNIKLGRPFSSHSFRKTFAYQKYIETGDIYKVMRMLNHSDTNTTLVYICYDPSDAETERENTYFGLS